MQLILDHISASLIGGTVLLIVLAAQFRSSEAAMDQTSYYASKSQILSITDMFESDFENIGLGVPPGTDVFTEVAEDALSFQLLLAPGDTDLATVRYLVVPADTIEIDDEPIPLYAVQRFTDGVLTGTTPGRLITFEIDLRNVEGDPVADPEDTDAIHVRYTMALPFNPDDGYLPRTHWARTFLAPNL